MQIATLRSTRSGSRRSVLVVAFLMLVTMLLSSCSGATVTTLLALEGESKGVRTITATVDVEDSSTSLTGGIPAVDASIRKNVPEYLSYQGVSEADGKAIIVFQLPFESKAEYAEKIAGLLKASGATVTPEIDLSISESGLVEGLHVEENFSSVDLLGWLSDGLVADGVVEKSNKGSIFSSSGESEVRYGDKVYKASQRIQASDVIDNGFDHIAVDTSMVQDGGFEVSVSYSSAEPIGSVQQAKIDAFLADSTPEDATVTNSVKDQQYANGMTVSFPSKDLESLNSKLRLALGSDGTELKFEEIVAPEDPMKLRSTLSGLLDCAALCSPNASPIRHTFHAPEGWNFTSGSTNVTTDYGSGSGTSESMTATGSTFTMVFERFIPLQSARVVTDLLIGGGVKQTFTYVVASSSVRLAGSAFDQLLAPAGDTGTFSKDEQSESTTFTAVLEGTDTADFQRKLGSYVPQASFDKVENGGLGIWPEYAVTMYLPLAAKQLRGGVTGDYTSEVNLPFLHGYSEGQGVATGTIEGRTMTTSSIPTDGGAAEYTQVIAKGPTMGGLIFLGVMAFLVLVGALAALVFRKKVGAVASGIWQRRGEAAAKARAAGEAARGYATAAAGSVSSAAAAGHAATGLNGFDDRAGNAWPGSDSTGPAAWTASFKESDLR